MKPEGTIDNFNHSATTVAPLIGVILIGGKSLRMGVDKASINYHGVPQSRYLFQLLSDLCDQTFLSCNSEQARQISALPAIVDESPEMGPMGGLMSVFNLYKGKALLTVPCDLPWLDKQTIAYLIRNRNPKKIATGYWNIGRDTFEPLLTIWEPAARDIVLRYSQQGVYSPLQVLKNSDVEIVSPLNNLPLKNVNSKAECEAAKRLIGKGKEPLP